MLQGLAVRELSLRRDQAVPEQEENIFLLLEGWACGQKMLPEGERQICSIHLPGDIPNLLDLAIPRRDIEYRAIGPCRVLLTPVSAMRGICRLSAALSAGLWRNAAVHASIAEEWITNIGRRRAIHRIAHLFCELLARMDAQGAGARSSYEFPLTQNDIGDATGLSTVHVNRVLQELRGKNILELGSGSLVVPDRARLAVLAGFNPGYLHMAPADLL